MILRIDSALARQIFYTTTRLGVYKKITEYTKEQNKLIGRSKNSIIQRISRFSKKLIAQQLQDLSDQLLVTLLILHLSVCKQMQGYHLHKEETIKMLLTLSEELQNNKGSLPSGEEQLLL